MESKALSGPGSGHGPGPVLLPGALFTTAKRSETTRADEPGRAELTPTGSDPVSTQRRTVQDASANGRPSPLTDCVSQTAELDHLSKFNSRQHPNLDTDKTSSQDTRLTNKSQTSDTSFPDWPAQNPPEMVKPSWTESLAQVVPAAPQNKESFRHKNRTSCTGFAFLPQDCGPGEGNPDSQSTEELKEPFLEVGEEKPTVFLSRLSTLNTAATPPLVSVGLTDPDPQLTETSSLTDPEALRGLHEGPFPTTSTGTSELSAPQGSSFTKQTHTSSTQNQEDHPRENSISPESRQSSTFLQDPVPLEPNRVSSVSSSEIRSRSGRRQQAVNSPSNLTCSQQSVHDPSMTSSSPALSTTTVAPQTVELAQRSHLHDHPNPSPPSLLTLDVCQPVAVREEIRLTPQIKGPPLLVPSPACPAQTGPHPEGRGPHAALPCWTRPLSRAAVMEGTPVILEVEVTPQPKPTLTWWVAYNEPHSDTQA